MIDLSLAGMLGAVIGIVLAAFAYGPLVAFVERGFRSRDASASAEEREAFEQERSLLRRADRLAQLAGDAALLAIGVAAQRMFAAEARRDRAFLERIVERGLRLEEIAHGERKRRHEFLEEQRAGGLIELHGALLSGGASCRGMSLSLRSLRRASNRCR